MIAHLWQSTLFAAAAGLTTLLLKRNPARTRYWVWLAALVKFLVPFALLVSLGGHLGPPGWRPKAPAIMEPTISLVMGDVGQSTLSTALTAPQSTSANLPALLFGVWVCGFLVILSRWLLRWMRVRADVRAGSRLSIEIGIPVVSSPVLREPGVFGILRPVLLLPKGMTEHLSKAEWEAILAHELCHARSHDNLTAAIYMLVETIFWFHPLVWWMGKRLVAERERACDEEVLRRGSEPEVYAEGILKVCELYLESPLECVAGVTGSNLRRRIRAIMTHRGTERMKMGKKLLLAAAGMLALAGPVVVGILNTPSIRAQSPQAAPAAVSQFEAASVKIHKGTTPGNTTRREVGPAGITYLNITLGEFIDMAYGVKHYQVAGPDWVLDYGSSDRYDLVAKAAGPLPPAQLWQMVVPVLEERFKLVVHRESKELPVYALVVAKGGPKFKEGDGGEPNVRPDGTGALMYKNYGMQELADALSGILERPTLNRTGLEGRYDFRANLQNIAAGLSLADQKRAMIANQGDSPDSPVFSNLEDQLGLKIESQKAPIPLIVVDHAEKVPTEN